MAAQWRPLWFPPVLSLAVYIDVLSDGERIGSGTGFVVGPPGKRLLVSNRHVMIGRRAGTNSHMDPAHRFATSIKVVGVNERFETWETEFPLYDADKTPLWVEHPTLRHELDLVGLPVPDDFHEVTPATRLELMGSPVRISVMEPVVVTGFPHAIHGGMRGMPVAVTGIIATHPGYSYDMSALPRFLINSRTKRGISGAPVFFYPNGKMVLTEGGTTVSNTERNVYELLGIYCGRIDEEADLGFVISVHAIQQMVENPAAGNIDV